MSEYEQVPLDRMDWGEQERKEFDPAALAALTETIRAHGVQQPVGVVRNGDRYTGLWGHRRYLACRAAGLTTVPAVVRDAPGSEAEAVELRLCENVARADLNPMELADGLARLMKLGGLTAAVVGARVGLGGSAVSKSLSLLRLPESIRDQIRSGRIPAGAGYALAAVADPDAQAKLAEGVAKGEVTRDEVLAAARRKTTGRHPSPGAAAATRVAVPLGSGRTITLAGPGLTSMDAVVVWLEDALAHARRARPQGIAVRTFAKVLKDRAAQPAGR
jgi:ParB family chromosome partitioning protein